MTASTRPFLRLMALVMLAALALQGCGQRHDAGVASELRNQLLTAKLKAGRAGRERLAPLARFYKNRGGEPAWLDGRVSSSDARDLAKELAALPGDGVYTYAHVSAMLDSALATQAADKSPAGATRDSALAALDIELTRAWIGAVTRLRHGAIPASALEKSWRRPDTEAAPEVRLAEALRHHAAAESLAAAVPADPGYAALRGAFAREVRAFQAAHALDTTGVADPATRALMTPELVAHARTVAANLERRRWLPQGRALPRVEVNIPDFTFAARADTGGPLRMRVVVGDLAHPTPVFSSEIAWMDLNPTWTLTRRVVAEEVLPALTRDHDYFAKHNMVVLRPIHGALVPVDPEQVVWDSVTSDTFHTYVRQLAGDANPLGHIRFMLPNKYEVFMHDTNQRGFFRLDRRAKSHGCVRLEKPYDLAAWLKSLHAPTPVDSVRAALRDTTSRRWPVEPHVPVDILYWTAWVDDAGVLQYREDLYGIDERLMSAIDSGHPERFELNPPMAWDVSP